MRQPYFTDEQIWNVVQTKLLANDVQQPTIMQTIDMLKQVRDSYEILIMQYETRLQFHQDAVAAKEEHIKLLRRIARLVERYVPLDDEG